MPRERSGDTMVGVSNHNKKDLALFDKLLKQVGNPTNLIIVKVNEPEGVWYNEALQNSDNAVRTYVRSAKLNEIGYEEDGEWIPRSENLSDSQEKSAEARSILGTPNHENYDWQNISMSDLGKFSSMQEKSNDGPVIINPKTGIVLFADEVEKLGNGESVITFHISGTRSLGFLQEFKEVYRIVDDNLQRIRGGIVD